MAHVFISYKHEDCDFVFDTLKPKLEVTGFDTWIDEERLRAGEDWRLEIDQAIRDSFAILAVITPESMQSQYVIYEWSFALGVGRKVVPLVLKTVAQLHPRLEGKQILNFTNRRTRPWDKLTERLGQIRDSIEASPEASPIEIEIRSRNTGNPIIEDLKAQLEFETDWRKRVAAIRKLGTLKALNVQLLSHILLLDPDSDVRCAAAWALGELKAPDSLEYLKAAAHGDFDDDVCSVAVEAIEQIGTPEALDFARDWRERQYPSGSEDLPF
jgi:hypothetical protein